MVIKKYKNLAVERVLKVVQTKIENYMSRKDKSLNSGTVS
jgi:hypothetical protein